MRIGTAYLLAAALALVSRAPAHASAAAAAAAKGVRPSAALAHVGVLIGTALPGVSLAALNPIGSLPQGLQPAKAAVLLERASALEPKTLKAFSAPAGEAGVQTADEGDRARDVLVAVNSVLRDIPVAELESMPADKLHGLAGLIMDQMSSEKSKAQPVETVAQISEASLSRFAPTIGEPAEELSRGQLSRSPERRIMRGVPAETRVLRPVPGVVYRHYTTREGQKKILEGGGLRNGFMSYLQTSGRQWYKVFKDLTGVFLTTPNKRGSEVGVSDSKNAYYVDIRLPKDLPLLEIEPGNIFLVPLPARTRRRVREKYLEWLKTGKGDPMYRKMVEKLDKEGGLGPELNIPVEIVRHGRR